MQLRKFYGRTIGGALAQVKRELGSDALILETNTIAPGSAAARMNPGACFEVLAACDPFAAEAGAPAAKPEGAKPAAKPEAARPVKGVATAALAAYASSGGGTAMAAPAHERQVSLPPPTVAGRTVLEDLGLLRSQIRQLLEGGTDQPAQADSAKLDLQDYHALIERGVDHQVLAPHFRHWLNWRTATPALRQYLARSYGGPAAQMQGEGFGEWLWLAWSQTQGLIEQPAPATEGPWNGPRMVGLVGPSGGGKTTTLAKLSSIFCHDKRQNAVIFTTDTFRVGATEQWRRYARLMGVPVEEIVSPEDISKCMERWASADWIGIDTPGGMTPESEAGRCYGSFLAQCPQMKTVLVLPATYQESVCREQMRRGRQFKAGPVLFSKLDETSQCGGIVNLTLSGEWKIDGFATGPRVPKDWEPVSREALWRRVLAPHNEGMFSGGLQ